MAAHTVCRVLTAALFAAPLFAAPVLGSSGLRASALGASAPARQAAAPRAGTADGSAAGVPGAAANGIALELAAVSPAVAAPGDALTIRGTITNSSAAPLARPVVRVVARTQQRSLDREQVAAWAAGTGPAQGQEVGRTALKGTLAPHTSAGFQVRVSNVASLGTATYGAVPLSVESGTASLRTFAGYQRVKQYQPMSIAWAVPLTLDPDPDLFGTEGPTRETAWTEALGPGSRVSRVLEATSDAPVTWAVDPTLTPGLLPKPLDTGAAGTTERTVRAATEAAITAGAARHTPWVLPDTDADVDAVTAGQGPSLMGTLVDRAPPVAEALGGRADVAWPADAGYTTSGEAALRRLFRVPAVAAQVTAASALAAKTDGATPGAAQCSTSGLALLTYDDSLSTLLSRTTSATQGVLSLQQFIADSAALLNELPGTQGRSILVTAPRTFNPDPAATRAFFDGADQIPWLSPTTTDAELASARRAVPTPAAPITRPTGSPAPAGPPPVLTATRIGILERTLRTVRGVALIRDDGDQFARTWTRAAEQLASTRWRTAPTAWNTLNGRVTTAARETTTALTVSASTINFLAESGRLQITVRNDLNVPVENVKLTVEASNPRLRIDSQPPVLRIGPRSRATVNVGVTALAAGLVPLRTTLTTPDGTVVGQGADVQVRVTPTGDWVYWALGGLAGAILLLGLIRSFTRRSSDTPRPRPAESLPRKATTS